MEPAAAKRPFLDFPLRRHFEQNRHVRYRLERYRAGQAMTYDTETAESIGTAIAQALLAEIDTAEVERDGAARAADLIATLL